MATQDHSETFKLTARGKGVFAASEVGLRVQFVHDEKTGRVTESRSSGATLKRTKRLTITLGGSQFPVRRDSKDIRTGLEYGRLFTGIDPANRRFGRTLVKST